MKTCHFLSVGWSGDVLATMLRGIPAELASVCHTNLTLSYVIRAKEQRGGIS